MGEAEPIHLGPFELAAPISRGGLAVVWRGTHPPSGRPVAVKVIREHAATDPTFRQIFETDARAIARIAHDHVVRLYDVGEIDEHAAYASRGQLIAGSPYLAMEYAPNHALTDEAAPDFDCWRATMRQILAALAHVHARGMLHLDLKPGNVLAWGRDPLERRLKLTDFGTARRYREPEHAVTERWSVVQGTPVFMAPEQFERDWHAIGPWTDLYGAGALAFQLAFGRPPFDHERVVDLFHAHRFEPVLLPDHDGPDGLGDWLERMLAKRPADRFASAAHALRALDALGDGEPVRTATSVPDSVASSAPTPDARLRLVGLRPPPLVGRRATQDALWERLETVRDTRSPCVVVVHGAPGSGASRVARWLAERAVETGAARLMHARHDAVPGPYHGIQATVAAWLRARQQPDTSLRDAARELLIDPDLQRSDATLQFRADVLVRQADPEDEARTEVHYGEEDALDAVATLIRVSARDEPLVVWLEDAIHDPQSLRVAERIASGADGSALVVVSYEAGPDDLPPGARRRLDALADAGAETLLVGPLDDDQLRELLHAVLPLERTTADAIVDRVSGNPLFATTLLSQLIDQGALLERNARFALADLAALRDADLEAVWRARVQEALHIAVEQLGDRDPTPVLDTLEVAAALGRTVDLDEWHRVVGPDRSPTVWGVVQALMTSGIAELRGATLQFVHPLVRDAIDTQARDGGRASAQHERIARTIGDGHQLPERYVKGARVGNVPRAIALRVGQHLAAAGRIAEALPWVVASARADYTQPVIGHREVAYPLLSQWLDALPEGAVSTRDRLAFYEIESVLAQNFDELGIDPWQSIARWEQAARDADDPEHLALALQMRAYQHMFAGQLDRAIEVARQGLDASARIPGNTWCRVDVLRCLAEALVFRGLPETTAEAARIATELLAIVPDPDSRPVLVARYVLGQVHERQGRPERALEELGHAIDLAEAHGWMQLRAVVLTAVSRVQAMLGDTDAAITAIEESARTFRRARNARLAYPLVGLAELLAKQDRLGDVHAVASEALAEARRWGLDAQAWHARLLVLEADIGTERWDMVAQGLDELTRDREHAEASPLVADTVRRVARRLDRDGQPELAARARELSPDAEARERPPDAAD